jgi:hypothetical protein
MKDYKFTIEQVFMAFYSKAVKQDRSFEVLRCETRSEESDNTSNVGATTWVKEDKMPNLGPFTGNPGVKQILTQQTCDE